jgi:hypothetical protein
MTEHDRKPVRVGFIGLGDDSDVRDVLKTTGFSQLVVVERIDVDAGAPEGLCRGRIRGGKIIDDGHMHTAQPRQHGMTTL